MKILEQKEYEQLRERGYKFIGRIHKGKNSSPIYFKIEESKRDFSCTEILDTISLVSRDITSGKYIVIRHWCFPEEKNITYQITDVKFS